MIRMNWTSLFVNAKNLKVFILGTGEVATRRANRFLDCGAEVVLAGSHLDNKLKNKGAILVSKDVAEEFAKKADLVVIASDDIELSEKIASMSNDKLLNRADFPEEGNIIVPTTFSIGDAEISIFTNCKSPLMARTLRKKIQSTITEEDIKKIELQDFARNLLKEKVSNQKLRKEILYSISRNDLINEHISNNEIEKAKRGIEEIIDDY